MKLKTRLASFLIVMLLASGVLVNSTLAAQRAADPPYTWGTGADGDVTVAGTYNIHVKNHPGRACVDGGDGVAYEVTGLTASTATLRSAPAAGCLMVGDEILLINMQGSSSNTGNYELLRIQNLSANLITFTSNKTRYYGKNTGDDSGLGASQRVMLQRVPNYNNLTVTGTLTGKAWDGTLYGLLVFKVKGVLQGSGNIMMDYRGYRGGGLKTQGESWPGVGTVATTNNGGGGAGNTGCPGGQGNYAGNAGLHACQNPNGLQYGTPPLTRLFLGSGSGGRNEEAGWAGGGVIYMLVNSANYLGAVSAKGQDGGMTGAGSGGSIRVDGANLKMGELNAMGGTMAASSVPAGVGRIALYYVTALNYSVANPAPYKQQVAPTPTPSPTHTRTATLNQTSTAQAMTATAQSLTATAQAASPTPDFNQTATAMWLTATAQSLTATAQVATPTPNFNETATAIWLTATAQAQTATAAVVTSTPDFNQTATAIWLTATAQSLTATAQVATPTPNFNETATAIWLTATAQAETATAAVVTSTPDFNQTATAIWLTATAQADTSTPDFNQTATAVWLTATARSQTATAQVATSTPDFGQTATAMWATATAFSFTPTPNFNQTATAQALTATAQAGSATPDFGQTATAMWATATAFSFTPTPNFNQTATAQALTATAQAGSATPDFGQTATAMWATATAFNFTPTPNFEQTATAQAQTATAQAFTATPDFNQTATAIWATATAFVFTPTPNLSQTATAQALTATAQAFTPTPDYGATATAQANQPTPGAGTPGSGNGNGSGDEAAPESPRGATGALCDLTLRVYVYVDNNNDSLMAAQGEGVNALQVNFLDTSFGKVGQAYTANGKATFCVPDYLKGQTLRVDIPYLQRTGTLQAPDENNKNQPLEMWFRLEPPTLPLFIP